MLARYCGPGLLGLGITALIAGFMSGMAGNVSAFATVWTYDIYRALIRKHATDSHYLSHGPLVYRPRRRWSALAPLTSSCTPAASWTTCRPYSASSSRRFLEPSSSACSGNAPRPPAASGASSSAPAPPSPCGPGSNRPFGAAVRRPLARRQTDGGEYVPRALVLARLRHRDGRRQPATKPLPDSELAGLVYGCTAIPSEGDLPLLQRPIFWAVRGRRRVRHLCNFVLLVGSCSNSHEGTQCTMHLGMISIWFFIGLLLLAYGILILGPGSRVFYPSPIVVLAESARRHLVGHAPNPCHRNVLQHSAFAPVRKIDDGNPNRS